ncbi:MAG: PIG-L deacetylase family protein [Candidatus Hermodarchaeota archaeon]
MLKTDDRVLILAPHPDDEVLGCGGVILQAIKKGLPLKIVFFTYGDSNEWSFLKYRKRLIVTPKQIRGMGLVRYKEALEAVKILGLSSNHVIFLGYPDFSTLNIWYSRWRKQLPLLSTLTKVREVPYENAFRPGALYKGEEILKDLKTILSDFRPTKIFLSHRNDLNTDHQAMYLFTRIVLWDLKPKLKAQRYPYLIHFDKWPYPRAYQPLEFLNPPKSLEKKMNWITLPLTDEEVKMKYEALKAHKTQFATNKKYLDSFIKKNELFGDYTIIPGNKIMTTRQIDQGAISSNIPIEELLLDEEGAMYVGIIDQSIKLENSNFIVSVTLSGFLPKREGKDRPKRDETPKKQGLMHKAFSRFIYRNIEDVLPTIKEGVLPITIASALPRRNMGLSFYLFGYRFDQPFGDMPKIWVRVGRKGYNIFDLNLEVPEQIEIVRTGSKIKMTVPLELLGDPDRILINVKNSLSTVTLDWVPWRIIKIKD